MKEIVILVLFLFKVDIYIFLWILLIIMDFSGFLRIWIDFEKSSGKVKK